MIFFFTGCPILSSNNPIPNTWKGWDILWRHFQAHYSTPGTLKFYHSGQVYLSLAANTRLATNHHHSSRTHHPLHHRRPQALRFTNGKVINFSEILGNVPKFWDSSLKFLDSVPKFIWEIFRPPTDPRALIFLQSKEHDKWTFTEPVHYSYNCVSRGHCATIPRFQVKTCRPTCWMRAACWSTDCLWNSQQYPVVMVAVYWILLQKQVMMTYMANAQLSMTILLVSTSCSTAMTRRMRNLKMIIVKQSTEIQVMTVEWQFECDR